MAVLVRINNLGNTLIAGQVIEGQGTIRIEADGDLLVGELIEDPTLGVLVRRTATHAWRLKGELIEEAVL